MPTFVPSNVYEERTKKVLPSDLVLNIGVIILILTILATVGVYVYGRFLDNKTETARQSLTENRNYLAKLNLKEIRKLNTQSQALTDILGAHSYPSSILSTLENVTNDNVTWTKLDMIKKDAGITVLNLSGEADSNAVIVQQVDALKAETKVIQSVTLVKSSRNEQTLRYNFDLEVQVNPNIQN